MEETANQPETYASQERPPVNEPQKQDFKYAGFWIRFIAYVIDSFVLVVPSMIIYVFGFAALGLSSPSPEAFLEALSNDNTSLLFRGAMSFLTTAIALIYFAAMESGSNQGTLGKMAMGLKVVDTEGKRISFGKAVLRYFGKLVGGAMLYIGYLMIGFTAKKQGLHDLIASTYVIRTQT